MSNFIFEGCLRRNAHFQNCILKILADFGLQNGAQKVKETEHQSRIDFGGLFWLTFRPRGVSDPEWHWLDAFAQGVGL